MLGQDADGEFRPDLRHATKVSGHLLCSLLYFVLLKIKNEQLMGWGQCSGCAGLFNSSCISISTCCGDLFDHVIADWQHLLEFRPGLKTKGDVQRQSGYYAAKTLGQQPFCLLKKKRVSRSIVNFFLTQTCYNIKNMHIFWVKSACMQKKYCRIWFQYNLEMKMHLQTPAQWVPRSGDGRPPRALPFSAAAEGAFSGVGVAGTRRIGITRD